MSHKKKILIISVIIFSGMLMTFGFWKQSPSTITDKKTATFEEQEGNIAEALELNETESDLDRPLNELWTAQCEHNIIQYTCDECRYELGVVKLSPAIIAGEGKSGVVAITEVVSQSFSKELLITGEVAMSEAKTVRISSQVPGIVQGQVADIGQSITTGDILLGIDSQEATEAKADYLKKLAVLKLARKNAEREANLYAKKISAEVEVQEAQTRHAEAEIELSNARAQLVRLGIPKSEIELLANEDLSTVKRFLAIRAPQSGIVIERYANAGERVESGKELLLLSDLSEVWVWANIKEAYLPALTQGNGKIVASIVVPGIGGKEYRSTVDCVAGKIDEQTRTARARITVSNHDGLLRPGMFVNIQLLLPEDRNVTTVPKVAVLLDEDRPFVFIHKDEDYWVRRPVITGETFGEYIVINEGVTPGQKIIADGSFLLKSDVLREKMGAGCAD